MIRIILYLLGTAVTGYLALIYPKDMVIMVFVLEVLLFLPALLYSMYLSRKVKVSIRVSVPVAEKNQAVDVDILVDNQSGMPLLCGKLYLKVRNYYHKGTALEKVRIQSPRKSKTSCRCRLSSGNCGKLSIAVGRVYTGDPLGIFYLPVSISKRQESLSVMPVIQPMELDIDKRDWEILLDSDEYDTTRGGEDPSEVFQIRSYRRGDRMQSIHWKMTARSEDLMVKEFSRPLYCAVVMFLDMRAAQNGSGFDNADEYLERVLAVSSGLMEAECRHMVVWYDRKENQICRMQIETQEHLYGLIEQLFQILPYTEGVNLEELYHEEYPYHTYCLSYLLNLKLELWEGGGFSCRGEKKLLS